MQAIAAWLVARRMHAVLALALTIMLPFAPLFSGAVMVMLVLFGGARTAALQGLAAIAVLATAVGKPILHLQLQVLLLAQNTVFQ